MGRAEPVAWPDPRACALGHARDEKALEVTSSTEQLRGSAASVVRGEGGRQSLLDDEDDSTGHVAEHACQPMVSE